MLLLAGLAYHQVRDKAPLDDVLLIGTSVMSWKTAAKPIRIALGNQFLGNAFTKQLSVSLPRAGSALSNSGRVMCALWGMLPE